MAEVGERRVPAGVRPTMLFWTMFSSVSSSYVATPWWALPDSTLRSAGPAADHVAVAPPWMMTPLEPAVYAGDTNVPAAFVPTKLPTTWLSFAPGPYR